jgi:hypothetical protein
VVDSFDLFHSDQDLGGEASWDCCSTCWIVAVIRLPPPPYLSNGFRADRVRQLVLFGAVFCWHGLMLF